jgi:hypothetical protein
MSKIAMPQSPVQHTGALAAAMERAKVKAAFAHYFSLACPVAFNPNWANNTGYYDFAVKGEHMPAMNIGEMIGCEDNKNRRLLMIAVAIPQTDEVGRIVIFDRYSDRSGVFTKNTTRELDQAIRDQDWYSSGAVRSEMIMQLAAMAGYHVPDLDYVKPEAPADEVIAKCVEAATGKPAEAVVIDAATPATPVPSTPEVVVVDHFSPERAEQFQAFFGKPLRVWLEGQGVVQAVH